MKLVIYTQYMENYGAHDWDGKGSCPQYWKMKGGNTYVVENLTPAQCRKAVESGCPTLRSLIEYSNDGSREYVVGVTVLEDKEKVGDEWETPVKLSYENGAWVAREQLENDEYACMNHKIARCVKSWIMLTGGDRRDYTAIYTLKTGETGTWEDLAKRVAWA